MFSFFPSRSAGLVAGLAVAGLIALVPAARAQDAAAPAQTAPAATQTAPVADVPVTPAKPIKSSIFSFGKDKKKADADKKAAAQPAPEKESKKEEKVIQSKDTRNRYKKDKKIETLAGVDAKLPDKALFDKAQYAIAHGHFDVARLDLQTMLNTYPDSQYQMRAKLAIADSWYKEGGTAALTQAESEYADFRVFFPNAPEAAEAQMRIGDIYFRQMDRPDRDYAKATHAEEEYRRMLTDYPDSTLVPQAKQRLRDVQEVLATREAEIAGYYATRENWAATIARYQTVVDTYPLYSHMDDALIGLGDAYSAQAHFVRGLKMDETAKAKLEATFDGEAAAAYRKVVLEHSAAAHVEDARDRLAAMNLPIPTPTLEQAQASQAMENSRNNYRLTDRVGLIILHKPDTVTVAHIGDPTLTDPKPTLAPDVTRNTVAAFNKALHPDAVPEVGAKAPVTADGETTAAAPATTAAPLQFQDVPAEGATGGATTGTSFTAAPAGGASSGGGNGVGMEVLSPGVNGATGNTVPTAVPGVTLTAKPAPLPAIEKAAEAPTTVNEISAPQAAAQAPRADGKKTKPEFDKGDESSSKHKKKKGLKKLNPL
ncbi:outer membrane protein assembly factor BamD [Granulicella sp. WH15]|uniref:outer membrane protein assembly factor BamD n=1 Tax=Granulicella sp. WH15 TaxID=2602070 RepID=UPI0013669668|nr:outer membrane protein assembly factor BamD [Granulicella sp. WH15]QHN04882.1 outer membrane protein assembly factor BamD [Granulicella sp. WH15]